MVLEILVVFVVVVAAVSDVVSITFLLVDSENEINQ